MRQLISFLGRNPANPGEGYRVANYEFGPEPWPPTPDFGLELVHHVPVDRLILFGTSGSMWDVLLAKYLSRDEDIDANADLESKARAGKVTQADLAALQPLVKAALGKIDVELVLITDARTTADQISIVERLAALLGEGDEIILDVTHSYRHLPMLALSCLAYLRQLRHVKLRALYYGALDMTANQPTTPVLDLQGLADLTLWSESLAAFDASGDLGALAPALRRAGFSKDKTKQWLQAAFYERNQSPEKALPLLKSLRDDIRRLESPPLRLYLPQLEDRLAWVDCNSRWQREWALAERHLRLGDHLRAASVFAEAAVSRSLEAKGPAAGARKVRIAERKQLRINHPAVNALLDLRDTLVHGYPKNEECEQAIESPDRLQSELRRRANEVMQIFAAASLRRRSQRA